MSEHKDDMPVGALNGRWRTRRYEDADEFHIIIGANGVSITGKTEYSDSNYIISDIACKKYEISFTSYFSQTGRRVRTEFQYDPTSKLVRQRLTFSDACIPYRLDDGQHESPISGTWRNDEDEMRTEYTVTGTSGQQTIQAHDFIDGEQYEVSDIRHHETGISFRTYMRSMSRRVHVSLNYIHDLDIVAMVYTWSESCLAYNADSDPSS